MSGIQDFYRGDTQRYKLTLKDVSTGTPIDLTGATIWFTMKPAITDDDTNAVIQKQVTSHTDAVKNHCFLSYMHESNYHKKLYK